ncbi:MAG: dienelactone hydrolase family protein [Nitratireductor sp.]|nr:dienelactone hydrolase family protein [Nitratireductor sp.]
MSHWIELKAADGHGFEAYVCEPQGQREGSGEGAGNGGSKGTVVLLQEIFGVNGHIQAVAKSFAEAGYHVIAPSLMDRREPRLKLGYQPEDVQRGLGITRSIAWDDVLKDVQAAVDRAPAGKVSVVGFCWGGSSAWFSAARVTGLSAAVCYYGGSIPANAALSPTVPVMMHWGEKDAIVPLEQARAVAAAHQDVEAHYYPADHGFNCDQRAAFHAESARLAMRRTLDFLARHG